MNLLRAAAFITGLPLAVLHGQGIAYEGGLSVATGKYVYTTRTTSWTLATGLSIGTGALTLRLGVPLYAQNSTLVQGTGPGMLPAGGLSGRGSGLGGGMMSGGGGRGGAGTTATTAFRTAPGDPLLTATWRVLTGDRTTVGLGVGGKLPLTDTANYGTGQWDYGGSVSLTRRAGDATLLGLDVWYWHLGDPPTLDLRDPLSATVTVNHLFSTRWGTSVFFAGGTSALRGYDGPLSTGATLTHLGAGGPWGLTATVGLTNTVPDFTLGASWRIDL